MGGNIIFNKISTIWFYLLGLFTISKWIKQYFPPKRVKKIYFSYQINLTIRPNKKNIESLNINLKRKVNILRLWRGNLFLGKERRQWQWQNSIELGHPFEIADLFENKQVFCKPV